MRLRSRALFARGVPSLPEAGVAPDRVRPASLGSAMTEAVGQSGPAAGGGQGGARVAWIAAVAFGLAVHVSLAAGLLNALPASLRLALAFCALVLLPGYAWVRLGALPPGGWWLSAGWAFGLGVMWNAVLILATRALGLPFTVLATWSAGGNLVHQDPILHTERATRL